MNREEKQLLLKDLCVMNMKEVMVGDNHFVVSSIPPEHDYICWVNSRECATRDYVLYLKDDEKIKRQTK